VGAAALAAGDGRAGAVSPPPGGARRSGAAGSRTPPPQYKSAAVRRAATGAGGGGIGLGIGRLGEGWEHARPDPGSMVDPSALAQRRLPHHADAEQVRPCGWGGGGARGGGHEGRGRGAAAAPTCAARTSTRQPRPPVPQTKAFAAPAYPPPPPSTTPKGHLEAEKHLKAGRHGEWTSEALDAAPKSGVSWGVTLVPPGCTEESHPDIADIVRSQNKR
jgi:hypothetical protein